MAGVFDIELQDGELGQDVSDDDAIEIEEVRYKICFSFKFKHKIRVIRFVTFNMLMVLWKCK